MEMEFDAVTAEIDRRLNAAAVTGSPNRMSGQRLRVMALDYLNSYDEELTKFPEEVGQPHWDLWMADTNYDDALFAVIVFSPDGLEFFCGTGNSFDIREFAGREFPDDPAEMFIAMQSRFRIIEPSLRLDLKKAKVWLERDW